MNNFSIFTAISHFKINTQGNITEQPHQARKQRTEDFSEIPGHFRIHAKSHAEYCLIRDKVG